MATPGQLVKCIAEALGIPEPTVVQYDRLLAENDLRSKGGRGTSAAKVTAVDAANLLIAIMGSPVAGASIKPAIETCKTYGGLRVRLGANSETVKTFRRLGFPTMSKLPKSHSFREGLASLISAASVGESLVIPDEDGRPPLVGPANDWFVELRLEGPTPWAHIMVDASLGEARPGEMARLVYHNLKRDRDGGYWAPAKAGNLHQSRSVDFKAIRRIGALLGQQPPKAT
ncbi:hypothetical protein IVB56_36010 [Bradyrhizobium sp. CW7]|uniref:hypothetical protein n=1 Tax=Bradyrhizobium sp. CW7 TaxID=2782688 RepID=UPI001FF89A97|nr:hypothetical protein [Bradyrhizobium sp. CW7]MCK1356336.1 hypothetical protein [Bradyrhizobium sp. CW7]